MPTTVSVHTDDRDPDAAPYRVSAQSGKSRAVVTMDAGAGLIDSYRVKLGGTSVTTGKDLGSRGPVCGHAFKAGQIKCGHKLGASPVTENVDFAEATPNADGDYTVNVYTLVRGEGWV